MMNPHRQLDLLIADWRKQMLAAGIKAPVPLDELENHLREECDRQLEYKASVEEAFKIAVRQIGGAGNLKNEFKKIERKSMKKKFIIIAGIFGILFGMAFVMPALAQYKRLGFFSFDEKLLLPLGIILTLGGLVIAVSALKKRHA